MKIVEVAIDSVSQDPANLRKHGPRNLEAIVASLRKFGQQKPIVVSKSGIILAGNGTWEAAKSIGWSKIKIVRTNLTGSEAIGFSIADNRTAQLAEWDEVALAETLRALESEDFEIAAAGFTEEELSAMIQKLGTGMLGNEEAPQEFESYGDDIETEYCCPKCNYKWSGKPA
jgi:ParB-like chromosome segregation protein Spo0J